MNAQRIVTTAQGPQPGPMAWLRVAALKPQAAGDVHASSFERGGHCRLDRSENQTHPGEGSA